MPNLDKAAIQFDGWMRRFVDSHRAQGHLADNNKALVAFLDSDRGFNYVKTYDELCQLAVLLQEKEYATTNPPCAPVDFARAIERAHPESFGGVKPTIPREVALQLAAEKFDGWMRSFVDSHREEGHLADNNKALVAFLDSDSGFKYVKTYDELCQLAVLLQEKEYATTNPPCAPVDFARAIERAHPESFGGERPVMPVESEGHRAGHSL